MKKAIFKSIRAFTMVELVFIIVVIGILSAVIIPKMQNSRLREGIDQIVSHIRYTQHLAMMNDKFDPNNPDWFKERWQLLFELNADDEWVYTIFTDIDHDGQPDYNTDITKNELAVNPQDSTRFLSGGRVDIDDSVATKTLNIGKTYAIKGAEGVKFENCPNNDDRRIVFDYMGRPINGDISADTSPYPDNRLLTTICTLAIKDNSNGVLKITIEPETGLAGIIQP